ncbi:MAG: hypothetical protein RIB98_14770 [Acidimicrobiales bacterium]
MSDSSQGDGWWQASNGKWYSPEQQPGYRSPDAISEPALAEPAEPQATASNGQPSGRGKGITLAVVAVVLLVAGYLAVSAFKGTSGVAGGAGSPEAAVEQLVVSIDNADVIGLLASVDPSESGPLIELHEAVVDIAGNDLGVAFGNGGFLDGVDIDLGPVDGRALVSDVAIDSRDETFATVELDSLRLAVRRPQSPSPTVAVVSAYSDSDYNSVDLWTAAGFRDVDIEIEAVRAGRGFELTVRVEGTEREYDVDDVALDIVTVNRDGRWYAAPGYSIADQVLDAAGWSPPQPGEWQAVLDDTRAGEQDPIDAVEALAEAVADFDIEGALQLIDPIDARLPHDLWPSIEREIDLTAVDRERAQRDPQLGFIDLELVEVDGQTRVEIAGLEVTLYDDYGTPGQVELDGWCVTVAFSGDRDTGCLDDAGDRYDRGYGVGLDSLLSVMPDIEDLLPRDPYLVVEERDGRWFVAPFATIRAWVNDVADGLRERRLESDSGETSVVAATTVVAGTSATLEPDDDDVVAVGVVTPEPDPYDISGEGDHGAQAEMTEFVYIRVDADAPVAWGSRAGEQDSVEVVAIHADSLDRTVGFAVTDARESVSVSSQPVAPTTISGDGDHDIALDANGIAVVIVEANGESVLTTTGRIEGNGWFSGKQVILLDQPAQSSNFLELWDSTRWVVITGPADSTIQVTLE